MTRKLHYGEEITNMSYAIAGLKRDLESKDATIADLVKALERAYDTMKDFPDFFEEGTHEHKALTTEAEAIRAALAKAKQP
jgi:hypothetical protein